MKQDKSKIFISEKIRHNNSKITLSNIEKGSEIFNKNNDLLAIPKSKATVNSNLEGSDSSLSSYISRNALKEDLPGENKSMHIRNNQIKRKSILGLPNQDETGASFHRKDSEITKHLIHNNSIKEPTNSQSSSSDEMDDLEYKSRQSNL